MNRSTTSHRTFSIDQLHAAFGEVGGAGRAEYLSDIVAEASRTRQRPGWTFVGGLLPAAPAGRYQGVPRLAVQFAVVLLLVAVVVEGVVLVGSRIQPAPLPSMPTAWERVGVETPSVTGRVDSIAASPRGLLAVVGGDEPTHLAMSSDGRMWTLVPDGQLPPLSNDRGFGMPTVLGTERRFLMLTMNEVWTSADGNDWRPLATGATDPDLRLFGPDVAIAGGPGLVGVGDDKAWYSVDGSDWSLAVVPPPPAAIQARPESERMNGVTAAGNDLVAWGIAEVPTTDDPTDNLVAPLLWASRDGRTWLDVVDPGMDSVTAVAGGPDGFVATGTADSEAAVWFSPDGTTWERVGDGAFADPADLRLGSVAATSAGYVVVGGNGQCLSSSCPDQDVAIWSSADGRSWSRVPNADLLTGAKAYGAFAWGSRFLLGGAHDGKPVVWVSGSEP